MSSYVNVALDALAGASRSAEKIATDLTTSPHTAAALSFRSPGNEEISRQVTAIFDRYAQEFRKTVDDVVGPQVARLGENLKKSTDAYLATEMAHARELEIIAKNNIEAFAKSPVDYVTKVGHDLVKEAEEDIKDGVVAFRRVTREGREEARRIQEALRQEEEFARGVMTGLRSQLRL